MILLEPERTAYDLHFRFLGVPVRVHPWFWLVSAILGWPNMQRGFAYLFVWVACVFVSVLVHELGHVFAGQLFGSSGHVVLHSFGGLAIGSSNLHNRWQRIFVYFAGPLAGFFLFGLALVGFFVLEIGQQPGLGRAAVVDLIEINLFWGVLNLLPIWPLDGGQISRDFLDWLRPRDGIRISLGLSLLAAGILAANSLATTYGQPLIWFLPIGGLYMTLFFAMFALQSFQLMQQLPAGRSSYPDERSDPWGDADYRERDPDYWKR